MKKILLILSVAFIGCSESESICCKTVIDVDSYVITNPNDTYFGGRIWTVTYLDCENRVTQEEARFPATNPEWAVGDEVCN